LNIIPNETKHLSLKDVYLSLTFLDTPILFDDENFYLTHYQDPYLDQQYNDFIKIDGEKLVDIKKEPVILDDNEIYFLMCFTEDQVICHYYFSLMRVMNNLLSNNYTTILISDFDNSNVKNQDRRFHKELLRFLKKYFLDDKVKIVKLKKGIKYRLPSINIISNSLDKGIASFNKVLNEKFIDSPMYKTYNIKFKNSESSWTPGRGCIGKYKNKKILNNLDYISIPDDNEEVKQLMLRLSKVFICTWGGNHHINAEISLRHTKNSRKILILCTNKYKKEWLPFQKDTKSGKIYDIKKENNYIRYVFNVPNDLNDLQQTIIKFEKDYKI